MCPRAINYRSLHLQGKKLLIGATSQTFLDILTKKSLGHYFTTLKWSMANFDDMSGFLMKNWIDCTYQILNKTRELVLPDLFPLTFNLYP
jgi:hypothetical protein